MNATAASRDGLAAAVAFARRLRSAGITASGERVTAFVAALAVLDPGSRDDVYWAGRLALCASPADVAVFDEVFRRWVEGATPGAVPGAAVPVEVALGALERDATADDAAAAAAAIVSASAREVLRERDVATLDDAERAEVARLLAAFRLPAETRRTRRLVPARRGVVDARRTLRDVLERGGEPGALRRRGPRSRPRRVVLLVDVSGSMRPYADALLRFAHAAARGAGRGTAGRLASRPPRTEVFTLGTRLTRVTDALAARDPDEAMALVASAVPDWAGGTRLGPLLRSALDGEGRLLRGAVVVVLSDGWERDDPALLGAQMARLSRLAHRVVWSNPLKARPGYAPLAAGMVAALPHLDAFVEGHSVAALEALARVVAGGAAPDGVTTAQTA